MTSARVPTVTELITRELAETGEWTRHPWWRSDPSFLAQSGLTSDDVEFAFGELARTFDAAWARRASSAARGHWFLSAIRVPIRNILEDLADLGLALGSLDATNPAAASRLRRDLRDQEERRGAILEAPVAALLIRSGCEVEFYPKGRNGKVLDLRTCSDPALDIEVKVVAEDRAHTIARRALQAVWDAVADGLSDVCGDARFLRVELTEHAASVLSAPGEQSKLDLASLAAHAEGLANGIRAAVAEHDRAGYARSASRTFSCESWPRDEEGVQFELRGACLESKQVALRLYRNAVLDAAEKFEEGANGVIFARLDDGPTDLAYFAGIWDAATSLGVMRNVAAVVVMWRMGPTPGLRFGARTAVIFPNPRHVLHKTVENRLLQIFERSSPDPTRPIAVVGAPAPGPSAASRVFVVAVSVQVPPLATKAITFRPGAEPPPHLVENYLRRSGG